MPSQTIISHPISELCLCDVRFVQLDENNLIFQIIFVIDHRSTDIYSAKKKRKRKLFQTLSSGYRILGGGYNMVEYNITIKRFCIAERHIAKLAVWYGVLLFNEN